MAGVIRNVRTRTGKTLANTATVVRYLFEEGRDLTDVANLLQVTRKGLLTQRVMPWLASQGITARGAKCALVDHPLMSVRSTVYYRLHAAMNADAPLSGYERRVHETYLDPELAWGDAAVPDDTTWIQQALELLTLDTPTKKHGLPGPRRRTRTGAFRGRDPRTGEAAATLRRVHPAPLPGLRRQGEDEGEGHRLPTWPLPRSPVRRPRRPAARGRRQRLRPSSAATAAARLLSTTTGPSPSSPSATLPPGRIGDPAAACGSRHRPWLRPAGPPVHRKRPPADPGVAA